MTAILTVGVLGVVGARAWILVALTSWVQPPLLSSPVGETSTHETHRKETRRGCIVKRNKDFLSPSLGPCDGV